MNNQKQDESKIDPKVKNFFNFVVIGGFFSVVIVQSYQKSESQQRERISQQQEQQQIQTERLARAYMDSLGIRKQN